MANKRHQNHEIPSSGLSVVVRNGNVDQALRKLKKKVQDSGLLREVQSRQYFEKPSEVRKRKAAQAVKRWQKEEAKNKLPSKKAPFKSKPKTKFKARP